MEFSRQLQDVLLQQIECRYTYKRISCLLLSQTLKRIFNVKIMSSSHELFVSRNIVVFHKNIKLLNKFLKYFLFSVLISNIVNSGRYNLQVQKVFKALKC